jgi:hypothetical protein
MSTYGPGHPDPQDYLDEITEMLEDGVRYAWAESTLSGIYNTISQTGRVSDGQINAITNIKASATNRRGRHRR